MRIAVIGTGDVGRTLGGRFAQLGHEVVFTARNLGSDKMKACIEAAGGHASAAPTGEAVSGAEVVILATQYADAYSALEAAGDLTGKVVVDTTNPLKPDLSGLSIGHETSAGEEIQKAAQSARVVKCFNTTGFNIMVAPPAGAIMFAAGDDADAKSTVLGLAESLGFKSQDAGPISQARLLEPFGMLWISLAYRQGLGRDYAFSITSA